MPGREISLSDTGYWIVPDPRELPCTIGLNSAGAWVPQVDERYAEYESTVRTLRDVLLADKRDIESDRLFEFCLTSLSVNYRVAREAASRLRLFTTDTTANIARLAIGLTAEIEGDDG